MDSRLHAILCAAALSGAGILRAQEAAEEPQDPPAEQVEIEIVPIPDPEKMEKAEPPAEAPEAGKKKDDKKEEPAEKEPDPEVKKDAPKPVPEAPAKKPNPREEARAKTKAAAEADLAMVDGAPLAELVPLLGHERFRVRERAQKRLVEQLGDQADAIGDLCYGAYSSGRDPEIRMRSRAVLLDLVQRSSGTGKRGFVGIGLLLHAFFDKNGEVNFAIRVSEVRPDTPAQKAGLKVDDIITGIDNTVLADKDATQRFMDIVGGMPPGREVTIKYRRDGKDAEVKLNLMARPDLPEDMNRPKTDPEKLLREWLDARKKPASEP
ncbi:MAG: PDZ domain-containing protein [Verrucomicrobiales bacterium]